jgi:hypothetical protein
MKLIKIFYMIYFFVVSVPLAFIFYVGATIISLLKPKF